MRQAICKNCGAVFDENLEKCPYCGSMNRRGAYRAFRFKVSGMIDRMLGLRDVVNQSTSRMVLFSFLRSLLLIAVTIGLAFLLARTARVSYYNDPEYDREAYETIVWEDENLEKLDEAYEKNDFKTISSLYVQNSKVVRRWKHYADYEIKKAYQKISEFTTIRSYQLQDVLYFLYFPKNYVPYSNDVKNIDMEQYETMRQSVLSLMADKGYAEQELSDMYQKHADSYGYVHLSDLDAYVKE
ncbi:MAG: hypothetical protein K6A40_11615 [Solobacterium sp.]|nr:hypothetical protein [Solobacterium sp.]